MTSRLAALVTPRLALGDRIDEDFDHSPPPGNRLLRHVPCRARRGA
jgi:hypothetical protein